MNWNPLRRLTSRPVAPPGGRGGGGSGGVPTGATPNDVEAHISKFIKLESITKQLHKLAKKYEDLMLALYQSEKRILSEIAHPEPFGGATNQQKLMQVAADDLRRLLEEWLTFATQMDTAVDDHVLAVRKCVVDPLKRYQSIFSDIQAALKRRDQCISELQKFNQKVQRLESKENTGTNIAKLAEARRSAESCEHELQRHNEMMQEELPKLYEERVTFFQPCLEALIHSQVLHWGEATKQVQECQKSLSEVHRTSFEIERVQQEKLRAIRALSIVGGDT